MSIDYVNTLGAGAGFDTKKIVDALVEAERAPKQARIEKRIEDSESIITGLGSALSFFSAVEDKANKLNDTSDFDTFETTSSQTTVLTAAAGATASEGTHSITVTALAREQRTNLMPDGATEFTSESQIINSGTAFSLDIAIGNSAPVTHTVNVTTATPEGIVSAINNAKLDVKASLIDKGTTGTNLVIQLVGKSGTANQFSITPSVNNLLANDTPAGHTAADASLNVNGLSFTRSQNQITDILSGVTLNLVGTTSGAANLSIKRDTSSTETAIKELVKSFNNAKSFIDEVTDRQSNGALAGDSIFRSKFSGLKNIFTDSSSTPGLNFKRFSDIGIRITKNGDLEIDNALLSASLSDDFAGVKTLLSADTEKQSDIGEASRGIAGDISKYVSDLKATTGYLKSKEALLNDQIAESQADLEDLESRLTALRERYTRQFSSMNALVDELNNTKDNLVSTFENLPFTRKN